MRNKILVLGKGYLGKRIAGYLRCGLSGEKILAFRDAEKIIKRHKPSVIVNCIGTIGRNVDDCELDIAKSLTSNTFVPIILAEAALRHRIRLIHISSGCIFHYDYKNNLPLDEEVFPDFLELFYSRTKIYADQALKALSGRYPVLILRIRVPLDDRPHPKNLLTKLLGFSFVIDVPNSITYVPDFLKALRHLIKIRASGIYNVVNKGGLRYPALLDAYRKHVPDFSYRIVDPGKLGLLRTNLLLSTEKLEKSGFKARDISRVLPECVKRYLE